MKKLSVFLCSFLCGMAILSPLCMAVNASTHSSHYKHWQYGYGSSFYLRYTRIQTEPNWASNIGTALNAWNLNTVASVYLSDNASHQIISGDFGNTGWYGKTSAFGNIQLNNNTPAEYRTETVAHEIGHALGLDHVSCTSEVMREYGFKGSPQPYDGDKEGVRTRW